jgi:hypothetical protein
LTSAPKYSVRSRFVDVFVSAFLLVPVAFETHFLAIAFGSAGPIDPATGWVRWVEPNYTHPFTIMATVLALVFWAIVTRLLWQEASE